MKLALIVSALLLSTAARAEGTAYVDVTKVAAAVRETPESRQASRDLSATKARQQADVDAAQAQVAKAKPAEQQAAKERVQMLFQQNQQQLDAEQQAVNDRLMVRPNRIIAKVAAERRLSTIAPLSSVLYASPKLDITEEVLKRFKAGEGFTTEEEAAKLRAENASAADKLAAKDAEIKRLTALTKPPAPAVPPAPPTAPAKVASKGK